MDDSCCYLLTRTWSNVPGGVLPTSFPTHIIQLRALTKQQQSIELAFSARVLPILSPTHKARFLRALRTAEQLTALHM